MYELSTDCKLSSSDFDAIEELHSGLGALKLPPPQPTSYEYGAYLRQQRQQREACKPQICDRQCSLHHIFSLSIYAVQQQHQLEQLQQGGFRTHSMGQEVKIQHRYHM